MPPIRKVVEIDEELCDGCGICIPSCHEGALEIVDGKARIVADRLCDGLGACLGECPRGALRVVEREAERFVAPAPAAHAPEPADEPLPCGCPGSQMRVLKPLPALGSAPGGPPASPAAGSALGHWPVQIRLVPPHAPFLQDADLLVAADCVPVAMPAFHSAMLPGRAVMIGCPKFDDLEEYARKFAQIFARASVRRVTVAVMEVPCCQALPRAVLHGLRTAGRDIPVEVVVVGVDGTIQS